MPDPKSLGSQARPIDPTANVIALVEANAKSASVLRDSDIKFNEAQHSHLKEMDALRAENAKEARAFDREQARNIREVDQINAQANAAQILQAVNTNASVAQQTALTLAKQVTDTAAAQETRQSARDADTAKRLSAVELSMSKGEGKQQVSDPALTATLANISSALATLTANQDRGSGKAEGIGASWGVVLGVFTLIVMTITIITAGVTLVIFLTGRTPSNPPYVPAPVGTQLPAQGPAVPGGR